MKSLLIMLLLCAAITTTYAQWNTNGAHISNSNTGNVGIGLSSPEGKLHVKGVGYFGNEDGSSWHRIAIGGSGGNYGSVGYGYKYGTSDHQHTYAVSDFASQLRFDNGGFNFLSAPNGSAGLQVPFTSVMLIKQNGNVGIGTDNPSVRFEIIKPVSSNYSFVYRDALSGNDSYLYHSFSANYHLIGSSWNGSGSHRKLGFAVGNNDSELDVKLTIDQSGNRYYPS